MLLGGLWAAITGAALVTGPVVLGGWLALAAALAAAQAARSWKRDPGGRRPVPPAAACAAGVTVVAAGLGLIPMIGAGMVAMVGAAGWATVAGTRREGDAASGADVALTLACAALPAVAVAGPVLLRGHGLVPALVLVVYALVYDASAYLIGAGSTRRWEGPLAGVASIGSVTLAVAAIFPQLKGAAPWELGALAAVLTPLGPAAASLVLGNRRARLPALRRLDSLVLLGPLWALAAAALVS